jgi:hypothetical protein
VNRVKEYTVKERGQDTKRGLKNGAWMASFGTRDMLTVER